MRDNVLVGDCRERLKEIPAASVHMCCASPPYWGLRSYEGVEPAIWPLDDRPALATCNGCGAFFRIAYHGSKASICGTVSDVRGAEDAQGAALQGMLGAGSAETETNSSGSEVARASTKKPMV